MTAIAVLLGYLAVGGFLAYRDLPALWVRMRDEWGRQAEELVLMGTVLTVFLWPVRMPWLTFRSWFYDKVAVFDPVEQRREIEEANRDRKAMTQEIRRLERELNLRPRDPVEGDGSASDPYVIDPGFDRRDEA